jgi:DNA-binding MarR family transcriptional regulator
VKRTRSELLDDLDAMLRKVTGQSVLLSEKIATHAGISATALECLDLLRLEGRPTTPRRLASLTGLTTGAVTMLVDRLERAGFVRRVPNPEDRRSVLIEVLPPAARALEPVFAPLAAGMARVHKHYDNAALELVLDYLTRAHQAGAEHLAWLERASLQSTPKHRRDATP